jgi:transcriptional regulator with XRE-family HTH domain
MNTHLGKLILAKLKEKRISKSEFARLINRSRQNVQDILERESLDTQLLQEVSKALDYNFFEVFVKNTPDKRLIHQLKEAQKEIEYLKTINALLAKKK